MIENYKLLIEREQRIVENFDNQNQIINDGSEMK